MNPYMYESHGNEYLNIKVGSSWDVTPCGLVDIYQYFGECCCIHFSPS
jgi:hypothetical protein